MIKLAILASLIGVVVVVIVLATTIPVLWPLATDASTNITSMTGTDAGTTTIQTFWPIILLIIGLGLAVGLIVFALQKFGLISGGIFAFAPIPIFGLSYIEYIAILMAVGIFCGIGITVSEITKRRKLKKTTYLT